MTLGLETVTADRAQHAAALTAALGERFIASCLAGTPESLQCGLVAASTDALAACAGNEATP